MPKVLRPETGGRKVLMLLIVTSVEPVLPLTGGASRKVNCPLVNSSVVGGLFSFSAALQFGWPAPAVPPVARCCVQLVKVRPLPMLKAGPVALLSVLLLV